MKLLLAYFLTAAVALSQTSALKDLSNVSVEDMAEAIEASGFVIDNDSINTALAEDPAASRAALGAQTTTRGFVQRFGRLANGTAIVSNTAPEVGSNFLLHYGSGTGQTLTIVNKAAEFGTTGMGYIGGSLTAPDNKFSILVVAELRLNASYTSGSTAPDLTIAVNDRPFTDLGTFIAPPKQLHAQVRSTGVANADIITEAPSIAADDGGTSFSVPPVGVKIPVRLVIDGPMVRISLLGQTKVYRDARYTRFINPAGMGFYVQWNGPDSATQYYWAIHSIIANAPDLEESAVTECGEYGAAITSLTDRNSANIQGKLRVNTTTSYLTNQAPESANDNFAFPGTGMLGYSPYFKPVPYYVAKTIGVSQRATAQLSSAVTASDTDIGIYMQSLSAASGLASGAAFKWKFYGRFAANAGNKQIKIISSGSSTRFDSGALAENGTTWCMEFTEFRTSAGYGFHTKFESDSLKKQTYNNSTATSTNAIKITAALAADVVIDYYTCEIFLP